MNDAPAPALPVAELPRRALAYVLDVALLAAVLNSVHFGWLHLVSGGEAPAFLDRGWKLELFVFATFSIPVWLYFALLESGARQATLGKRALQLAVTDESGTPIGFKKALLRTAVKLVPWEATHLAILLPTPVWEAGGAALSRPGFVLSTLLVGSWLATVMLTPKRQGVHDLAAGTLVLQRAPISG